MLGEQIELEQHWVGQGGEGGARRKSSSSTSNVQVGGMGLGELHISRTDHNRGRSCTELTVTKIPAAGTLDSAPCSECRQFFSDRRHNGRDVAHDGGV